MTEIFLGTIVLEPNRWFGVTKDRWGTTVVSDWLDAIHAAGFDGIELWERRDREEAVAALVSQDFDVEYRGAGMILLIRPAG